MSGYENGRIDFLPHNVYGNMPLGAEALVALTMALTPGELSWWWGGLAGKLVLAGFAPLAALLRAGGRPALCVTHRRSAGRPVVHLESLCGLGIGQRFERGGDCLLRFRRHLRGPQMVRRHRRRRATRPQTGGTGRGFLLLSGWMAGAAIACKYTSLVLIGVPLLLFVVCAGGRTRWRAAATCAIAMSLACGPWFAKNAVQTGNPTYPLLANQFDSRTRTAELNQRFQQAHRVPRDSAGWRYSPRQAWHSMRRLLGESDWHSPLLIPCVASAPDLGSDPASGGVLVRWIRLPGPGLVVVHASSGPILDPGLAASGLGSRDRSGRDRSRLVAGGRLAADDVEYRSPRTRGEFCHGGAPLPEQQQLPGGPHADCCDEPQRSGTPISPSVLERQRACGQASAAGG